MYWHYILLSNYKNNCHTLPEISNQGVALLLLQTQCKNFIHSLDRFATSSVRYSDQSLIQT